MDKRVAEQIYAEKKEYVEETLRKALRPMADFGSIQYAKDPITGEEFVKVVEADGRPWYINVTGDSLQAIGQEVCAMVCGKTPHGIIKVREKQIAINKLFGGK